MNSIEEIGNRGLTNDKKEIEVFVMELKQAGASLAQTMDFLSTKLDITNPEAFQIIKETKIWKELDSNPFNQEFVDEIKD